MLLLGNCVLRPVPPVDPRPTDSAEAWASVLRDNLDPSGKVAFRRLQSKPEPLALAVAVIAAAHPGPSRDERLAFEINSYNTLAMYAVIAHDVPRRLDWLDRIDIFRLTRFDVAGTPTSLAGYETDILRREGDPRLHFALSCMAVSCPELPRAPFDAADIDAQLDAAARHFLSDPSRVRFDPATRTVRLASVLASGEADFLRVAPTLLAYVNRYRVDPVPEDSRIVFIPADWTVNDQPGDQAVPP